MKIQTTLRMLMVSTLMLVGVSSFGVRAKPILESGVITKEPSLLLEAKETESLVPPPDCSDAFVAQGFIRINNLQDLNQVRNSNANFVLGADIDLASQAAWQPIENYVGQVFEGCNRVIRNLRNISNPALDSLGFFQNIANTSTIRNLRIVNPQVSGKNVIGALAAFNYGRIERVRVLKDEAGNGFVQAKSAGGGLVGANYGSILQAHANIAVRFNPDSFTGTVFSDFGGLVGTSYSPNSSIPSLILQSSTSSEVTGIGNVGGLVGSLYFSAVIDRSFATGSVMIDGHPSLPNTYAGRCYGGLVGRTLTSNSETISGALVTDSYSTGSISRNSYFLSVSGAGGLVGCHQRGWNSAGQAIINRSYTATMVNVPTSLGGGPFIGWPFLPAGTSGFPMATYDSYYLDRPNNPAAILAANPRSHSQFLDQSTFENWDFANIWLSPDPVSQQYPRLR